MTDDIIEIKIKSRTGEIKIHHLTLPNWIDDSSLMMRLKTPEGDINTKELWVSRIARDYSISESDVRKLKQWEMSALIAKWLEYNDVSPANFLETSGQDTS